MRYSDDYPSCERTYATLRVYLPNGTDPDQVTRALDVEPSHTQRRGERRGETTFRVNAWFLTSEGQVESRDVGRHMDWVLDQIASALPKLAETSSSQCRHRPSRESTPSRQRCVPGPASPAKRLCSSPLRRIRRRGARVRVIQPRGTAKELFAARREETGNYSGVLGLAI